MAFLFLFIPPGAKISLSKIRIAHAGFSDGIFGAAGTNKGIVSHINAHILCLIRVFRIEEHHITGLQVRFLYRCSGVVLLNDRSGNADIALLETVVDQAGGIKAVGAAAAKFKGPANHFLCGRGGCLTHIDMYL